MPDKKPSKPKAIFSLIGNFILSGVLALGFLLLCLMFLHYPTAKDSVDQTTIIWQGNFTRIIYIFGILTAVFWMITRKAGKYNKSAIFLGIYWLMGGALTVWLNDTASSSTVSSAGSAEVKQVYPIPGQVLPLIDGVGIEHSIVQNINILISPDASVCAKSDTTEAAACFQEPNTIFYPKDQFKQSPVNQRESFSHEYLHYIWSITPQPEKDSLDPYIEQAYLNAKPYLDGRLKSYTFEKGQRIDELHSYTGTEIADSIIPKALLDHYKRYLPNRDSLPSYYPYPVQRYQPPVYSAPVYSQPIFTPAPKTCKDYGFDIYDFSTHQNVHHPNVMCF